MNRRGRRGASGAFSLVETLVAIGILLVAVTGPMSFAQSSLRAAAYARDQAIAFFLAQDAIEFVKHVRDENSLTDFRGDWLSGLAACRPSLGGGECMVSSTDVSIGEEISSDSTYAKPCGSTPEECRLWIDECSHLYGTEFGATYALGDSCERAPSKFRRVVRIDAVDGASEDDEVQISVKIYWQTHPLLPAREINVRENIMNWIQ